MKKLILALLTLALLGQCKKNNPAPTPIPSQLDLLPPATQTGQRTFGCLVNGQAWTPAGSPFAAPVFSAELFKNHLGISCRRSFNDSKGVPIVNQSIAFAIDSVSSTGSYQLDKSSKNVFIFSDYLTNCRYTTGNGITASIELTRFDPVARIVAGKFSVTLEKVGCGKITITEGRFDSLF